MAIKKIMSQLALLCFFLPSFAFADIEASNQPQQVIQIHTNFRSIEGKPSWLLILRDVDTGQVLPYLYDIKNNDNYWLAFSLTHKYRVIGSQLKFDAMTTITNFCHLEGGILIRTSMFVTLTGNLTSRSRTSNCHVLRYKQDNFPIVHSEESSS